jgi:Rps23 Pro-64 3,4-dihydroxylase Tpa1-like proline 4-hydroxylase
MKKIINEHDVIELSKKFINKDPFHHIIIDNFLIEKFAKQLKENFPNENDHSWWKYDNPLEKKFAFNVIDELHNCFNEFFSYLNSKEFLLWLEKLTSLNGLIADHDLRGGGLHLIKPGGKLDVHEDFNIHSELNLLRKINIIVYLNEPWKESWGGNLELWNHDMTQMNKKILPIFNRAVIFRTDMNSNHGHPHPLNSPEGFNRISLATYYYTKVGSEDTCFKSTSYKKLPGKDDGLDELRKEREKGRLTLNSKT